MSDGSLSQDEIDALLQGGGGGGFDAPIDPGAGSGGGLDAGVIQSFTNLL